MAEIQCNGACADMVTLVEQAVITPGSSDPVRCHGYIESADKEEELKDGVKRIGTCAVSEYIKPENFTWFAEGRPLIVNALGQLCFACPIALEIIAGRDPTTAIESCKAKQTRECPPGLVT